MKTAPWAPSKNGEEAPFSAQEISIADTLTLRVAKEPAARVSLLTGVYSAVVLFRRGVPFELFSDRTSEPLISYKNEELSAMMAIRPFISDMEALASAEYQTGFSQSTGSTAERNSPQEAPANEQSPQPVQSPQARRDNPVHQIPGLHNPGEPRQSRRR